MKKPKHSDLNRRQFFQRSLVAVGLGGSLLANAANCIRTRPQGQGPFYPERDLVRDTDLTRLDPQGEVAEGEVVFFSGVVQDVSCTPIPGALIEIWQANKHGKYEHSGDKNALPRDPNFQHWGRQYTGHDGGFGFLTIIPGHYPLDPQLVGQKATGPGQFRPPHIHVKVHARGFVSLTTQIYFDPRSYDVAEKRDLVTELNRWEGVPSDLLVWFAPDASRPLDPKEGKFSFTLAKRV